MYLPMQSGRFLNLGTSPVSCQKRVFSGHVAKLREDPLYSSKYSNSLLEHIRMFYGSISNGLIDACA